MRYSSNRKDNPAARKLIRQLERQLCDALDSIDMKHPFVQTDFKLHAFKATRLIFDDSDLVSLHIEGRIEGRMQLTTLLFTFSRFNDLLRFSGHSGEALQLRMSDQLLGRGEKPYIISLEEQPVVFTTCQLDLTYLIADDISCLSVEEITPLTLLQQAKQLRENIRDFKQGELEPGHALNQSLKEIASSYRYYLGLKELNLQEDAAREKAGLANEQLFKMAYHAAHHSGF